MQVVSKGIDESSIVQLFVQPTFRLAEVFPASRARVFARSDRRRAMGAADAGIIAIVQGIVRYIMQPNIRPDIVRAPSCQRIEFKQSEFLVPFHESGVSAGRALVATNAGHPSGIAAEDAF